MSARVYQKVLFGVLSLVYLQPFVHGIVGTVTARGIMDGLALNPQGMGMLGAGFLFPYATSMFFSGMMSAYFGPRKTLAGMFLIAGVGGLIFSYSDSLALACLGRAMTGIGSAVCLTSSFTLFARWFRGESYAKVTGLFFALGGTGSFLGAGPLSMANAAFGWRACYMTLALASLFFSALVFAVIRDWPTADAEKELGVSAAPRNPVTPKDVFTGLLILVKDRDFRRLALWFCAMASIYQPFVGLWAAPYFKDVFHLTETQAGFGVSMFCVGFVIGCPLLNWYCENCLHSNRVAIGWAGVVTAAGFSLLFLFREYFDFASIMVACLVIGIALNAPNTSLYASVRNVFGSRLGGIGSGIVASMSLTTGAVMQLVVSGLLSFATSRNWSQPHAYLFAFSLFIPAGLLMIYGGFTLTHATDPGHISPRSWRMLLKKQEPPAEISGRPDIGPVPERK